MKKIIVLFCFWGSLCSVGIRAQDCEVPIGIALPAQPELVPTSARVYLINKMRQMVTANGITADDAGSQFYLSAKIDMLDKHIIPGPPVQHSYTLQVTFLMVDNVDEKIFSSEAVEVKAVGTNETKAYMDGIRRINVKNPDIQSFLAEGKQKIIRYYDENYPKILSNAQAQSERMQYGTSLKLALSIPPCSKGYEQALQSATQSFQKFVDQQCKMLLAKARSAWAAQQNAAGASEAGKYLSQIFPDAVCYPEAIALYNEIKKEIKNDKVFEMKQYDNSVSLEKQRIEAMKEIGVAYGKGQKEKNDTTNIMWIK